MKLRYLINRESIFLALPAFGFLCGWYFDRQETERLTLFRDKSALYGRVMEEDEPPTWP